MVKNRQIFLSKIKSLLFYSIKFYNNKSILFKVYLDYGIIKNFKFNQRLIIIIIYINKIYFL